MFKRSGCLNLVKSIVTWWICCTAGSSPCSSAERRLPHRAALPSEGDEQWLILA